MAPFRPWLPVQALIGATDGVIVAHRKEIADLAIKYRLPTMFAFRQHALAGGFMVYAARVDDLSRRALHSVVTTTLAAGRANIDAASSLVADDPVDDIVGETEATALLTRLDVARTGIGCNDGPARHRFSDVKRFVEPTSEREPSVVIIKRWWCSLIGIEAGWTDIAPAVQLTTVRQASYGLDDPPADAGVAVWPAMRPSSWAPCRRSPGCELVVRREMRRLTMSSGGAQLRSAV